ncbi:transcription elongation factor A protein 3 isoform X20 [Brachyhypopomus gauderio]|uniref:transcription elongation factor A protein 3 isoform X20 n=1 Tax=Brachyhypopomus gauderio TaxID=698409 RepID=UPI0040412485
MTREEDLLRIAKKLDKMVSRNNTEGALDLLRELKNFNMTLKLLQETRIGMSVNGVRKHCTDEDVVSLAKILIKNWKRLLESTQSQKAERPNDVKSESEASKQLESPNGASPDREWRKEKREVELRKEKLESDHRKEKHFSNHAKDRGRTEAVDSTVLLPSLPSHPPPVKCPSAEVKKERRDAPVDFFPAAPVLHPPAHPRRPSAEVKKERKDSPDVKQQPPKKLIQDSKKERKDSTDSKSGQRRQSSDSKPQRRDVANSKSGSSPPPAKKLLCERRESHGSKSSHPGAQQRKLSTDSSDGWKSKPETPKTPSTPSSPLSPSFSCGGGALSPRLLTGESIRDKCIEMLSAALRTDDDFKDYGANCDAMAAEIEDHILYEIKATDMKYKNRVRSRISNLKDPKNPNLRKNVLGGAIELSRIATMTAEEMASDELKQLRNVLTQEAIREHQMAKTGGTTTDLLQCSKCKKKNCTYNQVQTRSADEPMTTFVLCNECGNRWKFC